MPTVGRVLETSLYVDQLDRSIQFYERLFGFPKMVSDDRFCALNVSGQQVLLLFKKRATLEPMEFPGGILPPHDGDGQTHLAFTIAAEDEAGMDSQSRRRRRAGRKPGDLAARRIQLVLPRSGRTLVRAGQSRMLGNLLTSAS